MKIRLFITMMLTAVTLAVNAQTAREILDKTAARLSDKGGITATFSITGQKINSHGTIAVKGRMYQATTEQAVVWYDGKTQWTYVKNNEEVNVSTPSEAEQAAVNPVALISIYKKGYTMTAEKKGPAHVVHLKGKSGSRIEEMYVTVAQKTFTLSHIRYKRKGVWYDVSITDFRTAKLSDATFRFNQKDYPKAEVIDLR